MRLLPAICRFPHSPLSVDSIARARNTTEVPLNRQAPFSVQVAKLDKYLTPM